MFLQKFILTTELLVKWRFFANYLMLAVLVNHLCAQPTV